MDTRARVSSIENFLVTNVSTNSSKLHLLLAPPLIAWWTDYLRSHCNDAAALARNYFWPTDLLRVVDVAASLYRRATPATPTWAGPSSVIPLGPTGQQEVLDDLSRLAAGELP
jgi:hypothetical protein